MRTAGRAFPSHSAAVFNPFLFSCSHRADVARTHRQRSEESLACHPQQESGERSSEEQVSCRDAPCLLLEHVQISNTCCYKGYCAFPDRRFNPCRYIEDDVTLEWLLQNPEHKDAADLARHSILRKV